MPFHKTRLSPDPLDVQHAVRRPERGQRYYLPTRMSDALTGRRDGRHDGLVAIAERPRSVPSEEIGRDGLRAVPPVEPVPLIDAGVLQSTLWLLRN